MEDLRGSFLIGAGSAKAGLFPAGLSSFQHMKVRVASPVEADCGWRWLLQPLFLEGVTVGRWGIECSGLCRLLNPAGDVLSGHSLSTGIFPSVQSDRTLMYRKLIVSLSLPSRWIESSVLNASGFPIGFHVWKNTSD